MDATLKTGLDGSLVSDFFGLDTRADALLDDPSFAVS
jgi:hypothetical protein